MANSENLIICHNIVSDILHSIAFLTRNNDSRNKRLSDTEVSQEKESQKYLRLENGVKEKEESSNVSYARFNELLGEISVIKNNLVYVTDERDHWRNVSDVARKEAEKLSNENYMLKNNNEELSDLVEEQSKVCTSLTFELMEIIWSLSSVGQSIEQIQQIQLIRFLKRLGAIVNQLLNGYNIPIRLDKSDAELISAIMGVLVNLSSSKYSLVIFLTSEEGRFVVVKVGELVSLCSERHVLRLGFMFLTNVLKGELKYRVNEKILSTEALKSITSVVRKSTKADMFNQKLQNVASRLEEMLDIFERSSLEREQ